MNSGAECPVGLHLENRCLATHSSAPLSFDAECRCDYIAKPPFCWFESSLPAAPGSGETVNTAVLCHLDHLCRHHLWRVRAPPLCSRFGRGDLHLPGAGCGRGRKVSVGGSTPPQDESEVRILAPASASRRLAVRMTDFQSVGVGSSPIGMTIMQVDSSICQQYPEFIGVGVSRCDARLQIWK